jgi:hypothetical protein
LTAPFPAPALLASSGTKAARESSLAGNGAANPTGPACAGRGSGAIVATIRCLGAKLSGPTL